MLRKKGIQAIVSNEQQWKDYRRRRNLLAFAFIGFVPIVGTLGYLTKRFLDTDLPFDIIAPCWAAFFAVAGIRLQLFTCPRCRKRFFMKFLYRNPFASRCLHCGLAKYSESSLNQ
jgi:hypothetical protein